MNISDRLVSVGHMFKTQFKTQFSPKGPGMDTKFIEATLFTIPVNKLDVRIIKDVVLQENSTFLYKLPASLKEATLTSLDNFHSALQSVE